MSSRKRPSGGALPRSPQMCSIDAFSFNSNSCFSWDRHSDGYKHRYGRFNSHNHDRYHQCQCKPPWKRHLCTKDSNLQVKVCVPLCLPCLFEEAVSDQLALITFPSAGTKESRGTYHLHDHPGGNFWCKYSAMHLVQTQNWKIAKCTSINWKAKKEKKKCILSR